MTANRPLWRWWLFCATLHVWFATKWQWAANVYAWAVLPEWLGWTGESLNDDGEGPW